MKRTPIEVYSLYGAYSKHYSAPWLIRQYYETIQTHSVIYCTENTAVW